uniref:Uncharacterized protein n=1 Tax=Glossina palpalis gambiensis TaxID=67801 RepID=A0A1B0BHK9_9MUSC
MGFYTMSQLDLPQLWYTVISGHSTTQSDAALRQQHPIEFYRRPKTQVINEFEDSEQRTNAEISTLDVNETSVQLVDLSTSPPHETLTFANQTDVLRRIPNSSASPPSTQRSSLFSQYSRSSSSDDCSLSISTNGGGGNYISHSNNFDDGAENFVINFPADTASLPSYKNNDCIINLPLSETEPLLTNIEATVNDSERSIYLHKNSSSLIFTKKELPNTLTSSTSSLANNNLRRTSLATITVNNKSTAFPLAQLRRNHSSLRSSSEENHKRKPTKHLPASYQQLQRRSLQLNYNNNLITTSTCSVHRNNNQCCGGNTASNSAVLHKLQQSNRTKSHTTNVKLSSDAVGTITSAGASRRQYSYSWYAPVYSALEEELEQDSRDSSPIHNLANPKKKQINNYHQQKSIATTVSDNDTEVLLEPHNHINIQAQLHTANSKRNSGSLQAPAKLTLPLQHSLNSTFKGRQPRTESIGSVERGEFGSVPKLGSYETEGPQAGSLGLAGGPQPRRIRFGNFLKSLVGLRPSVNNVLVQNSESYNTANAASNGSVAVKTMPSSPEITITRTPSEQNMVVLRNPSASHSSREKLANGGSSTSLNVMQQKLWNMMKRDGSSNSLNHEKSQSIVQYTNLRKCETVLALTRQANSLGSPTLEVSSSSSGYHLNESNHHAPYTGSGIFSANGVEQIRPLNRLRNSTVSINATCSRCSSLLSMAASGSRYSLNATPGSIPHLRNPSILSSSNLSSNYSRNGDNNLENLSIANKSNNRINFCAGRKTFDSGANNVINSRTSSVTSPTTTITTTASTTKLTSPPTDQTLAVSSHTASPREVALATATLLGLAKPTTTTEQTILTSAISNDVVDGVSNNHAGNIASAYASLTSLHASFHSDSSSVLASVAKSNAIANVTLSTSPDETATVESATAIMTSSSLSPSLSSSAAGFQNSSAIKARPFEIFTCKLCLVDVENASDSTILQQCGCQFCTEVSTLHNTYI